MGTSLVDFEITVNATTLSQSGSSSSSSSSSSQTLLLTPASPAGVLPAAGVAARLLGDLSSYAAPPDLGGSVLLIPHPPDATSLAQILTLNTSEWLVVDKSLVSLDGRDCDRVGTSFPAFRSQPSACASAAGSCLNNQIRDLRAADAARVAQGMRPRHLIGRWGGGQPGAKQAFKRGGAGPLWLGLPLPSTSASLVTLSVNASALRVVTNVAKGTVRSARVCAGASTKATAKTAETAAAKATAAAEEASSSSSSSPSLAPSPSSLASPPPPPPPPIRTAAAVATCGSFQALTQTGYLTATVANEGAVAADFTVTVTNCSSSSTGPSGSDSSPPPRPLPVLPPPSVYLSLQPGAAGDAVFELHATSDASGGVAGASCAVSVLDALGGTTGLLVVAFSVNATEYPPAPVDGSGGDGDGGGPPGVPRKTCAQRCPSWRDLLCRLRARCW